MSPAFTALNGQSPMHLTKLVSRMLNTVILVVTVMLAVSVGSAQTTSATPATIAERQRGIDLFRHDKFADAAKVLKQYLKKNRSDEEAWNYLGRALLHEPKKIKDASKAFETAIKIRPGFAGARVGLSYSLLLRNKLGDAIREAEAALSLEPDNVDAHYVIGVVRLRTGAREDAVTQAETTIKLNPQYAPGYLLKSQALVSFANNVLIDEEKEPREARNARYSHAADALEKYLQLEPNSGEKQTWTEQLESLRFYVASRRTDKVNERVFVGREVTTKARVLSKPEPSYTQSARQAQVTGTVVLRAIFASDGMVKHFLVVKSLPYGLTEASLKAARKIKFAPATIDGRPVSMFVQLEYNFNLY